MPKVYFSQSGKRYFSEKNTTKVSSGTASSGTASSGTAGSGTIGPQTDQINIALDKYREIKTKRVTRKYAARTD